MLRAVGLIIKDMVLQHVKMFRYTSCLSTISLKGDNCLTSYCFP